MAGIFYFFLIFSLFSAVFSECDIGGTWSTWFLSPNQTGYDYCGACWKALWIRDCLSGPKCPCNGPKEFLGEMNIDHCLFPRQSCCPGYYKKVTATESFICVNRTTETIDAPPINETPFPSDYCPPSGVGIWGFWSEWETCTASCGQFGTKKRTRICTSEAYGCPCCNSDVGSCQTMPCPDKCTESCTGTLVTSYDGSEKYCYPFENSPATGSWTEWTPEPTAVCNHTCGMHGWIDSQRYCFPAGGVCEELEFKSLQPCPAIPQCLFPLTGCKEGFFKVIINGTYGCGLR